MRDLYQKRKLVAASWLLHANQYLRQYYSECYNRDIQVCNLKKIYLKENLLIFKNLNPQNIPVI